VRFHAGEIMPVLKLGENPGVVELCSPTPSDVERIMICDRTQSKTLIGINSKFHAHA
jgi:hypothetical protein